MRIDEIEGIGPAFAAKLATADVKTTEDLFEAGRTPAGRDRLATTTGISPAVILQWVNHADLMRIKGIGPEYADLLEAAEVDTVAELARRNPDNLQATMRDLNEARPLVRRVPTPSEVAEWVAAAKTLGRGIEY